MSALPDFVAPQLARLVKDPSNSDAWVHEVKFDGYRLQMRVQKGRARLRTRKGLDWTAKFPEIAEDGGALPDCIVDGEICAVNDEGATDFGALQLALSEAKTERLVFFLFDCLFAGGRDLRKLPLTVRKAALETLLKRAKSKRLRFVPHFTQHGDAMLEAACKMDMEGIISKRADAPYVSGRADSWTKSKCRGGQEVVIGGWRGDDRTMRSLMVGTHQNGNFVYMGRVGTGYTASVAADLLKKLKPLKRKTAAFVNPPRARDLNWVEPRLVAEIEFENITSDGIFRQAAFKGLRADKPADAVVPEVAADAPVKEKKAMAKKVAKAAARGDDVVLGVTISHPEKELWPKSKSGAAVTKLDLAHYMEAAAPKMLPHVADRPISIVRTPDGIKGETFYQRHALKGTQAKVLAIKVAGAGEEEPFLGIDSAAALVALAQQGVTEIHPWGSKPGKPNEPERVIFDLDPAPDVSFERVIEGAKELRARLSKLGFTPFVKTTGGKGLHVVIAVKGADWKEVKAFAKAVALQLEADEPDRYTSTIAKKARAGKIFVDYLRNDRTSTGVAPWSPRARDGAPIAVPIAWSQVKKGLDPAKWTIHTAGPLLKKADPWAGLAKSAKALGPALKKVGPA